MRPVAIGLWLLWMGLTVAGYSLAKPDGSSAPPGAANAHSSPSSVPEPAGHAPATVTPPGKPPVALSIAPAVPQAWDEGTVFNLQLPLADPKHSPVEVSWEYYYRIPRRPIYKSYPVYAPGSEPPGYFEWLKQQEPQVLWGVDSQGLSHAPPLGTDAHRIRAGELVFDAPVAYDSDPWGSSLVGVDNVRDPAWYTATQAPVGA